MLNQKERQYRDRASYGKRREYIAIAELLQRGCDVYIPLNDIHGFIINQDIHQKASKEFYLGLTFQNRAFNTETVADKQEEYGKAITHYNYTL